MCLLTGHAYLRPGETFPLSLGLYHPGSPLVTSPISFQQVCLVVVAGARSALANISGCVWLLA
jgi:hypothetical protein